jgi:hypothetical protein
MNEKEAPTGWKMPNSHQRIYLKHYQPRSRNIKSINGKQGTEGKVDMIDLIETLSYVGFETLRQHSPLFIKRSS